MEWLLEQKSKRGIRVIPDGWLLDFSLRPVYQTPHPKNSGIYPEKPGKSPENPQSETDALRIDALCA
jgi:hypothetical protein